MSDEVLVLLSVWIEVQIVCIWSTWYHCHPKTPSSFASYKSRLVLPFWYWLIQVVLEKRPLNGCSNGGNTGCRIWAESGLIDRGWLVGVCSLLRMRAKVWKLRMNSELFSIAKYTANLERVYRRMWEKHEKGEPVDHITDLAEPYSWVLAPVA